MLLDQRVLPHRILWRTCRRWEDVADGIRDMVVRGAPAIGCVAAWGMVLAARQKADLHRAHAGLLAARPTAVNLRWGLERMALIWDASERRRRGAPETTQQPSPSLRGSDAPTLFSHLEREAAAIEHEDRAGNARMGEFGAALLPKDATVMTICNTGSLATAGLGTAFGILWTAHRQGKIRKVIASETRPYLQGARLTAWELQKEKIPFELMTDNMAAHLMKTEPISAVIAGADRIAANGDSANKIGTYALAVLAKHHGIPFYIAAPFSTVDLQTASGERIPIEERSAEEVTSVLDRRIAPVGIKARHPAFDVTPNTLITAIITDRGIAKVPFLASLLTLKAVAPADRLATRRLWKRGHPPLTHWRDGKPGPRVFTGNAAGSRLTACRDDV